MLRIQPILDAKAAETYYSKSDGGYYLKADDLHREWVGKGAELLGLKDQPDFEQFKRLIHGLNPHSGKQLTAKLVDHRIPAWDVNVHCSKGVTTALERGDSRIQKAFWEATREAVADIEEVATTRVRKSGQQGDRITGNLVGYAVEHPETRPAKEDKMPDWHRHIHVVLFNLTRDEAEGEWKAVKFRPIMDQRKYFDRRFNMRFASKLADLGYEIETLWEPDEKGGRKYKGWDIKGIPESVIRKFSRRSTEIEQLADELGVADPVAKDKLGATSRLHKRDDVTLKDLRTYWDSRITSDEALQIDGTINRAIQGENPPAERSVAKGVAYALQHHFEKQSVVNYRDIQITAMERSMGGPLPEQIEPEARSQGLLIKDGEATTKEVLAEEGRVIACAREGRGTCRPMARDYQIHRDWLDKDQKRAVRHIVSSPDKYMLIRGFAGTGKTTAMEEAAEGIATAGKRVVALAQSTDAVGVLRENGFQEAGTIAGFLASKETQAAAQGQVLFIDEGSQIGSKTMRQLFDVAEQLEMRVVIFGDKRQHGSVERGAMLRVLEDFAGVPVVELTEIRRQQHREYKDAVSAIAAGDAVAGYDILADLGWVQQVADNRPLVEEYLRTIRAGKSVLVVAPTHAEGDEITAELRSSLKEQGIIGSDERVFEKLKPLGWSEAERGDLDRYAGDEILQCHRNSGSFRAGQRYTVADLEAAAGKAKAANFAVYAREQIGLASGDTIRITANGKDKSGNHKLGNGSVYTIAGFTKEGDLTLNNGWVVDKSFGHFSHGLVTTSYASQGKTVQRVLIAMGSESRPAINTQQFYVSASRGKESLRIFSDLSPLQLREAIQKNDNRKSATEFFGSAAINPPPKLKRSFKATSLMKRIRETYRQLRERAIDAIESRPRQPEAVHAR